MLKLYYAPDSIALAPHIALAESGIPYEIELIDHHGDKKTSEGGSYFDISPIGYVPALKLDDGAYLTESSAVLQYIADHAPDGVLCPSLGNFDRYLVAQWVTFAATELHQKFMRNTLPGLSDEYAAANDEQLKSRFAYVDARLAGRDFLVGDSLTIADIFVFVATRWCSYKEWTLEPWPQLARFMAAIRQQPAVIRALEEEGID